MRRAENRRVEAAGPVDAQNAPTRSLENAQHAFSTAPTRINNVLPMSPDKSVTYLPGGPHRSLQTIVFIGWLSAVPALAAGFALESAAWLAAGAWSLFVAVAIG